MDFVLENAQASFSKGTSEKTKLTLEHKVEKSKKTQAATKRGPPFKGVQQCVNMCKLFGAKSWKLKTAENS